MRNIRKKHIIKYTKHSKGNYMKKTILITGAAGYIGSHIVKDILECNIYNVIVIDFKSEKTNINALFKIGKFKFYKRDINDNLTDIFKENDIDSIIHLAGEISVADSIKDPIKYYNSNVSGTINILKYCKMFKIKKFIFSSTAAVYGNTVNEKIKEDNTTNPINPYGRSKLFVEEILKDFCASENIKLGILRYFNVAGCDSLKRIGELHEPETHIMPLIARSIIHSKDFSIFGKSYNTKDGTCIRDYIHVEDLSSAHLEVLMYLEKINGFEIFNCGYGKGFSNIDIVTAFKKIGDFNINFKEKRDGDTGVLVSDNSKILRLTKWKPKYNNIDYICNSVLEWERLRKNIV